MQTDPIVVVEDLSYTYPEHQKPALQALTFNVMKGECLSIMGPNGCGKSSLAKLLAGLLTPFQGSCQVLGEDLALAAGPGRIKGRVGIVFQHPDEQMVAVTLEREIAFGPENLGVPPAEIRQRVNELLERFNLLQYAHSSPAELSGGEKQRVAIASVLAMQPDLLILDEVTSLLDPRGRESVREMITQLRSQTTIVLITQFPNEALIGDRLLLMQDGTSIMADTPQNVFSHPAMLNNPQIDVPLTFRLMNKLNCTELPSPRK